MPSATRADFIVGMISHVVFGLVAAVLAYRVYRRIRAAQPAAPATAPVLVAA